jgi:hypothetical protein
LPARGGWWARKASPRVSATPSSSASSRSAAPVYLSQISYVNTGVGVAFAVLLFGERLSLWVWLAVALVFAGVAIVNRTAVAPPRPASGRKDGR